MALVIPAIWCAISRANLRAMKAPDAWIPPLTDALAASRNPGRPAEQQGRHNRPRIPSS